MKALAVRQPWANMLASGEKTVETRTWATDYRGDVLIVSSKTPNIPPAGHALAIAELVDCHRMTEKDEIEACCEVYPNAVAWVFKNIRRIKPFAVKGALRLFEVNVPPDRLKLLSTKT